MQWLGMWLRSHIGIPRQDLDRCLIKFASSEVPVPILQRRMACDRMSE